MSSDPWELVQLPLTIGETTYLIEQCDYLHGLQLRNLLNNDKRLKGDDGEEMLFSLCAGEVWEQLKNDKVPYAAQFRVGMAALQFQTALVMGQSPTVALAAGEEAWAEGLNPEAVAVALAAAIQKENAEPETDPSTTSTSSTSTASERKTPSRASTRSTTSRPTTQPTKRTGKATAAKKPARSASRSASRSSATAGR